MMRLIHKTIEISAIIFLNGDKISVLRKNNGIKISGNKNNQSFINNRNCLHFFDKDILDLPFSLIYI